MTMQELKTMLTDYTERTDIIEFEKVNFNTVFVYIDYTKVEEDTEEFEIVQDLFEECKECAYREEYNNSIYEPCYTYYCYEFCKGASVPIGDIIIQVFVDVMGEDL